MVSLPMALLPVGRYRGSSWLFLEVHRAIEDSARYATNPLVPDRTLPQLTYPPNGGLSDEERAALAGLASRPEIVSGHGGRAMAAGREMCS
jgi:hypothetical protein